MFNKANCLGVDISDDIIRIVELQKVRDRYNVVQASEIHIDDDDISGSIWKYILQTGTDISNVVCSIPSNMCSVKFLQLPSAKPIEIARMVRYEAENQIPLPLADMVWGYSVEKPDNKDRLCSVTIAAAHKSIADNIMIPLQDLGVIVAGLTPAALAETQCLLDSVISDSFLAVHIGMKWTDLTTVTSGHAVSCRSIDHGAKDLKNADGSMIDDLRSDPARISSEKWIDAIAQEVRRSVIAAPQRNDNRLIEMVVISGDGARILGIKEILEEKINMNVEIADSWAGMTVSPVVSYTVKDDQSIFATATGLAMSGIGKQNIINLIPRQQMAAQDKGKKETLVTVLLSVIVVMLAGLMIFTQSGINAKNIELDALNASISTAKKQNGSVNRFIEENTVELQKMVDYLQGSSNNPVEILRVLSENLPSGCGLSEFRFKSGDAVVIRGKALSNSAIADAIYYINKSKAFKSVSLDYSNLKTNDESSLYDFQIKCMLDSEGVPIKESKKSAKTEKRTSIK